MRAFTAFTKKEIKEQWRNHKILILFSVLLIFSMLSPLLAKLMPEIFSKLDVGIKITIPEPTYLDSYSQFFKNMTQMCILVVILLFGMNISQEFSKGTAILMLSKGLPRSSFILSKFTGMILVWTAGYLISAAVCYLYTVMLFPVHTPQNLLFSLFCLWFLVVFIISLITLNSTISSQGYVPLLLTAGVLILLLILNAFPNTTKYSPLALGTYNVELLSGTKSISDLSLSLIITLGLVLGCIISALQLFKNRQL